MSEQHTNLGQRTTQEFAQVMSEAVRAARLCNARSLQRLALERTTFPSHRE